MAPPRTWSLVLPYSAALVAAGLVGWFLRDVCLPDAAQPPTAATTTPAAVQRASPRTAGAPRPEAPPTAPPEPAPASVGRNGSTYLVGRVFLDGAPFAKTTVFVVADASRRSIAGSSITGSDGSYQVSGLDPGRAELQVGIPTADGGSAVLGVESLALVAGENHADVRIGEGDLAGEIAGHVEPPEGRAPDSTFVAGLSRLVAAGSEWALGTFVGTTPLDAKGGFRFRGLRAGRYRITLTEIAAGGRGKSTDIQVDVDLSVGERRTGIQLGPRAAR